MVHKRDEFVCEESEGQSERDTLELKLAVFVLGLADGLDFRRAKFPFFFSFYFLPSLFLFPCFLFHFALFLSSSVPFFVYFSFLSFFSSQAKHDAADERRVYVCVCLQV